MGKVTNIQLDFINESQEVSPSPAGDHKASIKFEVNILITVVFFRVLIFFSEINILGGKFLSSIHENDIKKA